MKRITTSAVMLFILLFVSFSCQKDKSEEKTYEELQQELEQVKAMLEKNAKISKVEFEGNQMVLTLADGSVFKTKVPEAIIPEIGTNGNWFVNGVDLGVSAEAKIPVVGTNGNWWVDGKDTGVKAEGVKGDKGDPGTGIQDVTYDETTGILTIVLTDGSKFEYTLSASQGSINGNLISDLNGEFVLTAIYNGDLPFAQFKYDGKNNLIEAGYYINVLNVPTKWIGMEQERDASGKIQKQVIREYAEIEKAAPLGGLFPDKVGGGRDGIMMTGEQVYDELFVNGIQGYTGTKKELIDRIDRMYSMEFCNKSYVYSIQNAGDDQYYIYKTPKNQYVLAEGNEQKDFLLQKEGNDIYLFTPSYSSWGDDYLYRYNEENWSSYMHAQDVVDLSSIQISFDYGFNVSFTKRESMICFGQNGYKIKAVPYTDKIDEENDNELLDYFVPDPARTIVGEGVTGKYKGLFCKFKLCNKGDEVQKGTLNYVYTGDDYAVDLDGEVLGNIVMKDGKIQKVVVVDKGKNVEILKFNYNGDLLETIDAPYANATEVAKVLYDVKNNPIEFQVNSSKLKGQGYEELLCDLGLVYKRDYYDKDKGCVVLDYCYTEGYTPLLKITYNYNLKNFMNHTLLAAHPILSIMTFNNAIEELVWAGHGNWFFAEYSDYNEGGYPQKVKGVLQFTPFAPEDEIMGNEQEYPVNGAVAVLYKLTYEKKK